MHYPCSENKDADLRLVFAYAKNRFFCVAAHIEPKSKYLGSDMEKRAWSLYLVIMH